MQDKIICDYCGTIYPAASHKCPICGNVYDPDEAEAPVAPAPQVVAPSRGPVSAAGFFGIAEENEPSRATMPASSQPARVPQPPTPKVTPQQPSAPVPPVVPAAPKPVRQKSQAPAPKPPAAMAEEKTGKEKTTKEKATKETVSKTPKQKSGKRPRTVTTGALVALCVLLVAVIGVGVFIWLQFQREFDPTALMAGQVTAPTQLRGGETPCTGLSLSNTTITLNAAGSSELLNWKTSPKDTTEEVTFTSADPTIAQVDENGLITAVAPGTVKITVLCGAVQSTCTVNCNFEDPTATTVPEETQETQPDGELKLSHEDVTLFEEGESFLLSLGSYANVQITWSSEDEEVATVSNGRVTAVGEGQTVIHAEVDGEDYECIVRCSFE